jgi:hypothetical protein
MTEVRRSFREECSVRVDKFGKKKLSVNGFFSKPTIGKPEFSQLSIDFLAAGGSSLLQVVQKHEFYVDRFTSQKFKGMSFLCHCRMDKVTIMRVLCVAIVKDGNNVVLFLPEFEKILNFQGSTNLCEYIRHLSNPCKGDVNPTKKKLQSPIKTMLTPQKKKHSSVNGMGKENSEPNADHADSPGDLFSSQTAKFRPRPAARERQGPQRARDPLAATGNSSFQMQREALTSAQQLSPQQRSVIERFCPPQHVPSRPDRGDVTAVATPSDANLFITGGAGTGKSFLITELVGRLRARFGSDTVHLTATTGKRDQWFLVHCMPCCLGAGISDK